MNAPVITVDGPSGSGKGTICRLLAEKTGFNLLDSGAIYRLAALACLQRKLDCDNEPLAAEVAGNLNIRFDINANTVEALLDDKIVTRDIRREQVGMAASKIAAYPSVRAALLECQQAFRKLPGLVADGRDMGTVVFPNAPLKIFLTATAQERASRRIKQLQEAGETAIDEQKILADIIARDDRDMNRATAPLAPAPDAIELDSTSLSINEVFETILKQAQQRQLC